MIQVEHLTKYYGNFMAVNDLSFTIEEGHVYGFLGPNGAGKSTTMNIVTGCLSPTEGTVTIGGYNILTEIDVTDLETALGALSADSFTEETPTGKEEIRFTAYLSNANFPKVEVVLYRYDGEHCLATVDGRTVSLIPRSQAVALMEAVNAIVLK